jgi:hypothetical protein
MRRDVNSGKKGATIPGMLTEIAGFATKKDT